MTGRLDEQLTDDDIRLISQLSALLNEQHRPTLAKRRHTANIITETINKRLREFGRAGSKAAAENRFTSSSFPLAFAFASRLLHRQNASSPLGQFGTCLNE